MFDLSKYLGDDVEAKVIGTEQDFSLLDDSDEPFDEDQKIFLINEKFNSEKIFTIRQVHKATVLKVDDVLSKNIPEADGLITNKKEITLSVRTADCVPIFLYNPIVKCIGLVHAGWRSAQQEIVGTTLKKMYKNFGSLPTDIKVVFGPHIQTCCYEVGQDMCEVFPEHIIPRDGKWFLDLAAINSDQLVKGGVLQENINDIKVCTCCNDQCFSYRREKEDSGRHLSLLRLKDVG